MAARSGATRAAPVLPMHFPRPITSSVPAAPALRPPKGLLPWRRRKLPDAAMDAPYFVMGEACLVEQQQWCLVRLASTVA